jgi:hypothetical protein
VPGAQLQSVIPLIVGILGVLAAVGFVLFLVGLVVRFTSLGSLIGMVDEIEEQEGTSFRSGLGKGWKRFLHLLAISILIGLGLALVAVVFVLILAIVGTVLLGPGILLLTSRGNAVAPGVLLLIGGGLVLVFLIMVFSLAISAFATVLRAYAFRSSVLDGKNVFDAVSAAWALIRSRLRESALMWLLLLAINLGLALISVPLGLLAAGAMVGPGLAIYAATKSLGGAILSAVPVLLIVIAVGILVQGIYTAFQSAVWTLMFRELVSTEPINE